jgi:hypothetical protein
MGFTSLIEILVLLMITCVVFPFAPGVESEAGGQMDPGMTCIAYNIYFVRRAGIMQCTYTLGTLG